VRQDGTTADVVFDAFDLVVSFPYQVVTLERGDRVCAGTPADVSRSKPPDRIEVKIQGIGTLSNDVPAAGM
jgi:2-keto-4-pentenoate hydratase/2-oxohepta-3-ene-1,7-dioic acid hydratase in catechol pathway